MSQETLTAQEMLTFMYTHKPEGNVVDHRWKKRANLLVCNRRVTYACRHKKGRPTNGTTINTDWLYGLAPTSHQQRSVVMSIEYAILTLATISKHSFRRNR